MKRKLGICALVLVLTISFSTFTLTYATSISDKQDELHDVTKEKEDASAELKELEKNIKAKITDVENLNESLDTKEQEYAIAESKLAETKKKMIVREDGLNDRLRVMYKNGSVGFLDVLLGSNSISEFISNVEMLKKIYENDMQILKTLKAEHKVIEKQKSELNRQKLALRKQKEEAEQLKSSLEMDKKKLEKQIDELNAEADRIKDEIYNMQDHTAVYEGGQFKWPTTSTYITSPFGFRMHPVLGVWKGHTGVDIGVSSGSPVFAAASGKVIVAQWYGGYGNAVVIDHGSGLSTLYGHNNSLNVSVGQTVSKGDVISHSGSTGISTGPHLHFEVRVNGNYVDPMKYF